MRLSTDEVRGLRVMSADGLDLGEVTQVFVEPDDWHVESLQVKLHRDVADRIGAERGMFRAGTVEIPTRMVKSVGDAVLLSVDLNALRKVLPEAGEGEPAPGP